MAKFRTLVAVAAVPVLIAGWALFRPELAFVNRTVNEGLPVSGRAQTLRIGTFASYAHETTGSASLVEADGTTFVRLTNFKTSNGPDVHLYLVKGEDPQGVEGGFLDLGTLKGNVGDQNYAVPAGTDLGQYGSVAIWCKRFSVGFGGASLPQPKVSLLQQASFAPEILVTRGALGKGEAAIVETGGKRYLRVTNAPTRKGLRVLLLKAETISGAKSVMDAPKIDLGPLMPGVKRQMLPLSKEIDAWLYRSVSLWDGKASFATAALRSDQERKGI